MMPSFNVTPGGSLPPSCRYLWTASRPVYTTPEISTSSPTFSARILSSVKGKVSLIIIKPLPLQSQHHAVWKSQKSFQQRLGMFARSVTLTAEHSRHFCDARLFVEQRDVGNRPAVLHLLAHHVMRVRRRRDLRQMRDAKHLPFR